MTNFRNLKIAINDQQPLDEVVKELERLGYKAGFTYKVHIRSVEAYQDGIYDFYNFNQDSDTTLAELKEM